MHGDEVTDEGYLFLCKVLVVCNVQVSRLKWGTLFQVGSFSVESRAMRRDKGARMSFSRLFVSESWLPDWPRFSGSLSGGRGDSAESALLRALSTGIKHADLSPFVKVALIHRDAQLTPGSLPVTICGWSCVQLKWRSSFGICGVLIDTITAPVLVPPIYHVKRWWSNRHPVAFQ